MGKEKEAAAGSHRPYPVSGTQRDTAGQSQHSRDSREGFGSTGGQGWRRTLQNPDPQHGCPGGTQAGHFAQGPGGSYPSVQPVILPAGTVKPLL